MWPEDSISNLPRRNGDRADMAMQAIGSTSDIRRSKGIGRNAVGGGPP
jgi:hypothetical protein